MSCPDCGKRVPILFNASEERRCLECLKKAISPYDYSIKNKIANHTELCGEEK